MKSDIEAIFAEADAQIVVIRELYQMSLQAREPSAALQAKIKNLLENERSTLEYFAHEIVERFGRAGTKTYYPVVQSATEFPKSFDKNMPGVSATRPDIRDAIEQRQPYRPGYEWLKNLCHLTNENKHRRLTPQVRTVTGELKGGPGGGFIGTPGGGGIFLGPGAAIHMGGGAAITFSGAGVAGGAIRMDNEEGIRVGGPGPVVASNVGSTIFVDWLFEDLGVSALGTLEEIRREVPSLIEDLSLLAGV